MTPEALKKRLENLGPGTQVEIRDLTGTQDHYQAIIVSPVFRGKKLMDQHRLVYDLVREEMATNELHALTMKTLTPETPEGEKHGSDPGTH